MFNTVVYPSWSNALERVGVSMKSRADFLEWLAEEQSELRHQLDLMNSGVLVVREAREGAMVDTTQEAIKSAENALDYLQALEAELKPLWS